MSLVNMQPLIGWCVFPMFFDWQSGVVHYDDSSLTVYNRQAHKLVSCGILSLCGLHRVTSEWDKQTNLISFKLF